MGIQVADLTNPATNPLPEEVQDLVGAMLEGRVRSLFIVAEIEDADGLTDWIEGYSLDMDEHESDERAFVGAVTMVREALMSSIQPQEFVIHFNEDDNDDNDE